MLTLEESTGRRAHVTFLDFSSYAHLLIEHGRKFNLNMTTRVKKAHGSRIWQKKKWGTREEGHMSRENWGRKAHVHIPWRECHVIGVTRPTKPIREPCLVKIVNSLALFVCFCLLLFVSCCNDVIVR